MNSKQIYKIILGSYVLVSSATSFGAEVFSRSLPPNEQIVIDGEVSRISKYKCRLEFNEELKGNEYQQGNILTFFSVKNRTIINKLIIPEGTLMNFVTIDSVVSDFTFELEPKAKLEINNDSDSLLTLNCNKL